MDALNSKYKYIQLCQNLPTYGVTFFLVKVSNRVTCNKQSDSIRAGS